MSNITTTPENFTLDSTIPMLSITFISLTNWVGPEISSSSFGALQPTETGTIMHFSATAKSVGLASKRKQPIDEEQWDVIKMLLWRLWLVKEFDRELGQKMNIKGILTMFATPANNFLTPIPEVATQLKERFESQNWGIPQPALTPILQKPKTAAKSHSKRSVSTPTNAEVEGEASSSSIQQSSSGSTGQKDAPASAPNKGIWAEASSSHPIFGLSGCMHHIALTDTSHYEICCEKGNSAVFGHNGFVVGQCWPRQIAAVRDGMHGIRQAGIHGSASQGVYSIIISGTYASLDHDTGDRVFYSVSGALTTTDSEPDKSKFTTQAMIRSVDTGTGIRVLRTSGGGWKNCPRAGMRYDGLYRAVGYQVKENNKGGKFLQFELVRMEGQPDIDVERPGREERLAFERVKDGY